MSTSLPDVKDPNMEPMYLSKSSSLSFELPSFPKNKRLKGLDVTFKYSISGDDWSWFCKISTTNGVDLMYNPKVFGKPEFGNVGIWLSYWPIGNTLDTGDKVSISIVVMSGLEVHECGVSLVYTDDKEAAENLENNKGWVEILGGDLSGFQLSTGAFYLCRRDFFELMEVDRQTPDWFRILVGDTIDSTEVRGWRKTGRPKHMHQSFTELKTVRCIIHGPELEEIYNITEMSKSSFLDKTLKFTSSMLGETMKFARRPISKNTKIKFIQVTGCALSCYWCFYPPRFNNNPQLMHPLIVIFRIFITILLIMFFILRVDQLFDETEQYSASQEQEYESEPYSDCQEED